MKSSTPSQAMNICHARLHTSTGQAPADIHKQVATYFIPLVFLVWWDLVRLLRLPPLQPSDFSSTPGATASNLPLLFIIWQLRGLPCQPLANGAEKLGIASCETIGGDDVAAAEYKRLPKVGGHFWMFSKGNESLKGASFGNLGGFLWPPFAKLNEKDSLPPLGPAPSICELHSGIAV